MDIWQNTEGTLPGGWRLRPNNQTGIGVGLTHGSWVRDCENMRNLKWVGRSMTRITQYQTWTISAIIGCCWYTWLTMWPIWICLCHCLELHLFVCCCLRAYTVYTSRFCLLLLLLKLQSTDNSAILQLPMTSMITSKSIPLIYMSLSNLW